MQPDGQRHSKPLNESLSDLSSSNAKLVYLYLRTVDGASIADMERDLQLTKLTLFGVLRALHREGFVHRHDGRYDLA